MNQPTSRFIAIAAFFIIFVSLGIFALPRVVRALPGSYVVRLQNHPLTSGVVELVTTPMPDSLPTRSSEQLAAAGGAPAFEIRGIDEQGSSFGNPEIMAVTEPGEPPTPQPSPTRETIIITVGGAATAEPGAAAPAADEPTPTPSPTATATPPPLPDRVMLENVPVEVQTFNNCGPANMTIVLNFWGVETTQADAASYLKPNREDRNVSPWQINDYVNEFTSLKSTAHASGTPEILKQFIAAGFPVVIEKGYEPQQGNEGWYGHYLTVYGYDDTRQEFYSRDTYLGPTDGSPRIDSYDEFMKWWQQFYYTFYVIYPEHRAGEVFRIIPEVLQDDETMWRHTIEIARRELQAESENVFTWFNLGVALTRLAALTGNQQEYLEATQVFDRARDIGLPPRTLYYEHRPFLAYYRTGRFNDILELTGALINDAGGKWVEEVHYWRGNALAMTNELRAAQEAYQEALRVNPNFYYAEWALDDVNSRLGD